MDARDRLVAIEARYLAARTARDRLDVARASGATGDRAALEATAAAISAEVHAGLDELAAADLDALTDEERRALLVMREGLDAADAYDLPVAPELDARDCADPGGARDALAAGGDRLRTWVEACFAAAAAALPTPDGARSRLGVLEGLGQEPDAARRRELFLALRPLWTIVDGDGEGASPYRRLVREAAEPWAAGRGPLAANAAALGVSRDEVEAWSLTALAAWRAAVVEPARAAGEPEVEPWDWWWRAGAAQRMAGAIPLAVAIDINRAMHASLGADLDALRVRLDLVARPGRAPVPVSFATFGARPHLGPGGWDPGEPVVMASLEDGGLSPLGELVHETGHAIHLAGIRTRPAFADWPDADALTEALADILAYDLAEPAWQRRWLPGGTEVPEPLSVRCHYAGTVLDAAWALFEIRLLEHPDRRPNDVWTELTATWLGIVPHPDWSWWAIRGQLVQDPGYMANYALGAVLATELRAAIRERRGDWIGGDPGWYPWVRERLYRFGRERSSGEVVRTLLGRPPSADALLAEIARAARAR